MSPNRKTIVAILLAIGITCLGTIGYMAIENFSFLDALYMTIITITTVGFGEIVPLSAAGRIFTIFLIVIGFSTLAFVGHAIVESLIENIWRNRMETKKIKKRISRLKGHFIICGYGRMGAAAAEYFRETATDYVIIDLKTREKIDVEEANLLYMEGDATREVVLLEAGIKRARGLLALLDSDPDNLFLVLTARELNPTLHIIARGEESTSEKKILRAGADSVVLPFTTAGVQVANDMLDATGKQTKPSRFIERSKPVPRWIPVQEGSSMCGKTVEEISREMEKEVVGLRREGRDIILPEKDTELLPFDEILIMDEEQGIGGQDSIGLSEEKKKIVIVDDNPVVVRLYTRLFQKAGFYPITATEGQQGLDTIMSEKPAAAVIDFMMPGLSGIEICRAIKDSEACPETKLIIFTADTNKETKQAALEAGADEVVIKSPDASEIVKKIIEIIS